MGSAAASRERHGCPPAHDRRFFPADDRRPTLAAPCRVAFGGRGGPVDGPPPRLARPDGRDRGQPPAAARDRRGVRIAGSRSWHARPSAVGGSPPADGSARDPHALRDRRRGRAAGRPFCILAPMSTGRCPICQGETFEIRAKLVCRTCGAILETCCEGGPMGAPCDREAARPAEPSPPAEAGSG
jgi:hypothetical protein